MTTYMKVDS